MSLTADSVSFTIKNKSILRGVYFSASAGMRIGIVGRNGSGKTTLFRILAGWKNPQSGVLKINNEFIPKSKRWKYISVLPQESFLNKKIRVSKCVALFCEKGMQTESILSDDRISVLADKYAGSLSGGERRYLEFLLVLSLDRQFVILDEPFSKIEPIYRERIRALIKSRSKKTCFIISDHNYRSIRQSINKLYLMKGGRLIEISDFDKDLKNHGYLPDDAMDTNEK